MGGSGSKFSSDGFLSGLTREKLLLATRDPRGLSDSIFLYLKDNIKIKTYFPLLSGGDTCNKFIFLLAQDIQKVFEKLPVQIGQQKGVLLFQSTEALTKKAGGDREITERYCQYVAGLITRVFQIYAALALSVLDNESVRGLEQSGLMGLQDRKLGFTVQGGGGLVQGGGGLVFMNGGGAVATQDGGFITTTQLAFPMGYTLVGGGRKDDIRITNEIIDKVIPVRSEVKDYGEHRYQLIAGVIKNFYVRKLEEGEGQAPNFLFFDKNNNAIECELMFSAEFGMKTYNFRINLIKVNGNELNTTITTKDSYIPIMARGTVTESQKVKNYNAILDSILTSQLYTGIVSKQPYAAYLTEVKGAGGNTNSGRYVPGAGMGSGVPMAAPSGLTGYYDLFERGVKPMSHCVTRALQLLQVGPGGKPVTSICKKRVLEKYGGVIQGAGLTSHAGLKALNALFFNVVKGEGGELLTGTQAKYQELLNIFLDDAGKAPQRLQQGKFRTPKCGTADDKTQYVGSRDAAAYAKKVAESLLGRQAKHAATVASIYRLMFNIVGKPGNYKVIGLNPKLYAGGDKYVEEIAQLARQVLVDYYKFCEGTYEQGRKVLMEKGQLI
jgi:hypothetical protein